MCTTKATTMARAAVRFRSAVGVGISAELPGSSRSVLATRMKKNSEMARGTAAVLEACSIFFVEENWKSALAAEV